MIKLIEQPHKVLVDGLEDHVFNYVFRVGELALTADKLIKNPLKNLRNEINLSDFERIVQMENFKELALIPVIFQSQYGLNVFYFRHQQPNTTLCIRESDGLNVFYFRHQQHISVFTFGEIQSARMMLTLESVWEIIA